MSKTSSSQSANALRILALDSIKEANSGHSGMPMGMADIAEVLWQRHLRHNPGNPDWFNICIICLGLDDFKPCMGLS